jgi:RNA polymerase sigma-70 factor (sigma-E family)
VGGAAGGDVGRAERDRSAYAQVFRTHRGAVVGLAYLLTGDRDLAEDVAAEAFARVWPHWRAGRVDDELRYLRVAVVNEVRSRWRRRATERRVEERRRSVTPATPGPTPEFERSADHELVVRAMAALAPTERAVIALRFLEDLSEAETARVLGIRPGTVKSRTSRALARLRVLLASEEEDG